MDHLDLQHQSQFANSVAFLYQPDTESPSGGSYRTHSSWYQQQGAAQDPWRSSTLPQLHCSPQTSTLEAPRWSSLDFMDPPAEEPCASDRFYQHSQPFCSPTTPGPSPHYPHTPNISSPQLQPPDQRLDLLTQLAADFDSFPLIPDLQTTSSQHPQPVSEQTDFLTGRTPGTPSSCFSPPAGPKQEVCGSAQSGGGGTRAGRGKSGWNIVSRVESVNI